MWFFINYLLIISIMCLFSNFSFIFWPSIYNIWLMVIMICYLIIINSFRIISWSHESKCTIQIFLDQSIQINIKQPISIELWQYSTNHMYDFGTLGRVVGGVTMSTKYANEGSRGPTWVTRGPLGGPERVHPSSGCWGK